MRITCPNCGQSYSDRFDACPVCGAPAREEDAVDEFFREALDDGTAAQPVLPPLELPDSDESKPARPVRRKGDADSGPIHRFAFGEEEDEAAIRQPARPAPQPRQYYQDTDEGADPSYAPRYARPRRRSDRVPVWMAVTISVLLGLALIVGGLTLAFAMGVFDAPQPSQPDPSLSSGLDIGTPGQDGERLPGQGHTAVGNIVVEDEAPATDDQFPVETVGGEDEPDTPAVDCASLSLDNVDFTLAFRGDHYTIGVVTEPEEAAQYVTWQSSDPIVASVDETGRVEARSKGTVTVTATCGGQTAKCIVRCEQLPPASSMINLSAEDITLSNSQETVRLKILDELTEDELAGMTWTSSKPEVASVDKDGVVTALTGGTTTITAQTGERIGACLVRCAFSGDGSYKISHSDVTMSYLGEYFNLYITHDGVKMTEVTWFTSDSSVASVNDMGVVTATGNGTATITTVIDGNSLQCIVRVRDQG